jgi:hypothetical protein
MLGRLKTMEKRKNRKLSIIEIKANRYQVEVITLVPNPLEPLCKTIPSKSKDIMYLKRNYEE